MSDPPVPLFIDTGAFFARFNERAIEHDRATDIFQRIHTGNLQFGPLFTSRYVLSELATLMRRRVGHTPAVETLATIRDADSFNVVSVGSDIFELTCKQFAQYDDQQISFVDHSSGVLADKLDIEWIFTFDPDDFHTLGFMVVPDDIGVA